MVKDAVGFEMKTLESLRYEAEIKQQLWLDTSEDQEALSDRDKTKCECLILASYFEGKVDAYNDRINKTR
jgi:hypothetical protein